MAVAVAVSACSYTTTSYKCSDGRCELTLNGAGADHEVANDTVLVTLDSADGSAAQLTLNNESVTCAEGETVQAAGVSVTCESVGDDEVTVVVE